MLTRPRILFWLLAFCCAALTLACDDDSGDANAVVAEDTQVDTQADTAPDTAPDTSDPTEDGQTSTDATDTADATDTTDAPDTDIPPGPRPRVEADLSPFTASAPDPVGSVRLWVSDSPSDHLSGPFVQGRVGDYVFESGRAKVVIEQAARVSGPCPFGGNVIDIAYKKADGAWSEDAFGELCPFINIGQTFYPERFDILNDGANGQAAVLAATGRLEVLDFIHVLGMAKVYVGNLIRGLPTDPDRLPTVSVTLYYVMRPGDQGVRVITALRNDGDAATLLARGHLIHSGGDGQPFNPLSLTGGFGSLGLSIENLASQPLPFLAFRGRETSFIYAPSPELPATDARPLPIAGAYITISGVSVSLLGTDDLLSALLTPPASAATIPGVINLAPLAVTTYDHWQGVGDPSLASLIDTAYANLAIPTGALQGVVTDALGAPVADAAVTALDAEGRPLNQARADAQGRYLLRAPAGDYTLRARLPGRAPMADVSATVTVGATTTADLGITDPGTLSVSVRDPSGQPIPARVTVLCEGSCPGWPTAEEEDLASDALPGGAAALRFTDLSGDLSITLAPGSYRVVVTRGLEWSAWPPDAPTTGGFPVSITANQAEVVAAEIAHVIDTMGVLSGDFHVHAFASPDSPVRNRDRILGFLGEGVDVIVSTDHDFIYDFSSDIAALGAQSALISVVGEEITTANYGHYNAFPLVRDPDSRNGGALDWGDDIDLGMTPDDIFRWVLDQPGEQVVQVNHANSGLINAFRADPLRRTTLAKASSFRLPDLGEDPTSGDTRFWSDRFTAMEVMNGYSATKAWTLTRWWLSMIARGFTPTGTAVSDTHKLNNDMGGAPRSFVFLSDDASADDLSTFDPATFAAAINAHRMIGSNGPFFRVEALNSQGDAASIGDTLSTQGQPVTVRVHLDLPAWMTADVVEVYMNLPLVDLDTGGDAIDTPLTPTLSVIIPWQPEDLQVVASGSVDHAHRVRTVELTLPGDADAYVVLMVRGLPSNAGMFPVVLSRSVKPWAFSNPLFLDADGGGYDNPPFKAFQASPASPRPDLPPPPRVTDPSPRDGFKGAHRVPRRMTHEDWGVLLDHLNHSHSAD